MAGQDREVELKLELRPGDAASLAEHPALRRAALGPARVQHLRTIYFDTAGCALAHAGISLRLRTGGPRQIQTVKWGENGAGGLFERGELEAPVDGDRPDLAAVPDEELRARIAVLLGDEPLEPVFETDMRRTQRMLRDGGDEWSADLDEGELRAGDASERLCELELELRHGEVARLYEMALELLESFELWPGTRSKAERGYALRTGEAPVPYKAPAVELPEGTTLDAALREVGRSCLSQVSGNLAAVLHGSDPEAVHQMRVGVRRMRSVFSVFRPLLPGEPTELLRQHLRWLARELGSLRDVDVFLDEILAPLFALRDDKGLERLREEAEALRTERRRHLREQLRSRRFTRLVLELGHWIERCAWREQALSERSALLFQGAEVFAGDALSSLQQKAERLGVAALGGPASARHELRIALKKLRYVSEFFRSLYGGRDVKRYLRRLSRLQDLLGALNDVTTAGRVLEDLLLRLDEREAGAHARAAGFVEGAAARSDSNALDELAEQWERFRRARPFWEADD
jgi:inorganic triphosphatase YgiF